jgi:peroxiredoxin
MNENRCIEAGVNAPDFILKDHNKKDFKLSDFKGKRILLSFHPLAWTSVCTKQMQSLEENQEKFKEFNTVAVGISIDTVPSKQAWAKEIGIENTRLLCDFWPHGQVARQYGIFRDTDGISERTNIIISEDQIVEYVQLYDISQLPDIQEIINVIMTMSDE